jgi:peroxiredoxin
LAELRSLRKEGEPLDIYALSVDKPNDSRKLAEKIAADGKGKVDYRILSDPGSKTIDAYGLRDPAYKGTKVEGIPHPAVYVIDKAGKVAWAKVEEDYKQRPSNAEIRAALDALK